MKDNCPEMHKKQRTIYIWNTHNLFETPKKAEPFLGVLDGAFLISYAVVSQFKTIFVFSSGIRGLGLWCLMPLSTIF
jgi:hypothetical protein